MYTNKLFESYNKNLNESEELEEKVNKDNAKINKAITNPNMQNSKAVLKKAGYDVSHNNFSTYIKNPKTGVELEIDDYYDEPRDKFYHRENNDYHSINSFPSYKKDKVDFKNMLDTKRERRETTALQDYNEKMPKSLAIGKDEYGNKIGYKDELDSYEYADKYSRSISPKVNKFKDAINKRKKAQDELNHTTRYYKRNPNYERYIKSDEDTVKKAEKEVKKVANDVKKMKKDREARLKNKTNKS